MTSDNVLHDLDASVRSLRGVGPKIGEALERRGILSVEDLLHFLPVRYEDRTRFKNIKDIVEGEQNVLVGRVIHSAVGYSHSLRKRICQVLVEDETGSVMAKWFRFNRHWMTSVCKKGNLLFLSGAVTRYGAELQMIHPTVTIIEEGRTVAEFGGVIPVYSEIEGLKQGVLRNIMEDVLQERGATLASLIPRAVEADHGLPGMVEAVKKCHAPDLETLQMGMLPRYVGRMIVEEFFLFQVALLLRKRAVKQEGGIALRPGKYHAGLMEGLPFDLTEGQRTVMADISRDMARSEPMNRLLQGDVGCGKTICAVLAACTALDSGYQAVFMAPTEILAEQHYLTIHRLFEGVGFAPVLLRGNMGSQRKAVLQGISRGDVRIVVGTHALLQEDVCFHRLGLIVVDEQHRFGVIQRSLLKEKGLCPDILVMSATPIPRTLSMVVYGDLDVSVIRDMPLHRQRVVTRVVTEGEKDVVYQMVRKEIRSGRQAFIVYPILEESGHLDLLSAKESFVHLRKLVFPGLRVGLLHGKMSVEEKEQTMRAFKEGKINILVCTTVIEVGIDIPSATVMVVEHAERFGLSQLHQLRGRVGRGPDQSYCYLVSAGKRTALATKRLHALEKMTDGFEVAEEDMKIRGAGDILGVRQAGVPRFRLGDVVKHGDIMTAARKMAQEALEGADESERKRLAAAVTKKWDERLYLGDVL